MLLNTFDDAVFVQEMHLVFGGMNIHVYILGGDLEAEVNITDLTVF